MSLTILKRSSLLVVLTLTGLLATTPTWAAEAEVFELLIKDHQFTPNELNLPANTRVKLTVKNQDATPAEFESKDFKVEKVIKGGKEASFFIGPFKPGSFEFHDEFHEESAKGRIIVK
jgi:heme/copper-type cytochrome/quinol oxidase subunit 2